MRINLSAAAALSLTVAMVAGVRGPVTTVSASSGAGSQQSAQSQTVKVVVTEKGFEPATLHLRAGAPAQVTFVRTTDKTCAKEVVFPSLKIKRALPLNEPVIMAFTPAKTGDIAFACGMNMLKGTVVVE